MPLGKGVTKPAGLGSWLTHLFQPADIASLVFFRIALGAIALWEVYRYFSKGWIDRYYIDPQFHFTYYGFSWVRPWEGDGMYWHFAVLGVLSVGILLGAWYRVCAVLFFVAFTYVFLLDQTQYLNHFYMVSLVSLLMCFVPAHRYLSVDAARRPEIRSQTAPVWALWILRGQVAVVYFFGGVAKLNADWLRGEPMRDWLAARTDFPVIGPLFTEEWMVYGFTYGGLLLDLLVVPLLLWKRTRWLALAAAVFFHLMNAKLFSIGIFPWFMIAATLLFLSPDWPRRLLRLGKARLQSPSPIAWTALHPKQRLGLILMGVFFAIQILMPLRHFLYPGNVSWTEEGHRFAWHMKLRDKSSRAIFKVTHPATGREWIANPSQLLTPRQVRKMANRPDMILQFAHYLAEVFGKQGVEGVEVYAHIMTSLNDRKKQLLIDPSVNLAAQPRDLWSASWILPLDGEKPVVP